MKTFCLILSAICGILFAVRLTGVGNIENLIENLIALGILDIMFYLNYLNYKIEELKNK